MMRMPSNGRVMRGSCQSGSYYVRDFRGPGNVPVAAGSDETGARGRLMRVLVCGGGVIGASIAYFLSRRGVAATVIERVRLACAASGKAGGFLALDWCDGTPLEALARRSFALHTSLAEEIGEKWGYRRLTTYGGFAGLGRRSSAYRLDWPSARVTVDQRLGSRQTTAQVHPAAFTAAMMRAAQAQGAELRRGQVTGVIRRKGGGAVAGVEVDGKVVDADAVV